MSPRRSNKWHVMSSLVWTHVECPACGVAGRVPHKPVLAHSDILYILACQCGAGFSSLDAQVSDLPTAWAWVLAR